MNNDEIIQKYEKRFGATSNYTLCKELMDEARQDERDQIFDISDKSGNSMSRQEMPKAKAPDSQEVKKLTESLDKLTAILAQQAPPPKKPDQPQQQQQETGGILGGLASIKKQLADMNKK